MTKKEHTFLFIQSKPKIFIAIRVNVTKFNQIFTKTLKHPHIFISLSPPPPPFKGLIVILL